MNETSYRDLRNAFKDMLWPFYDVASGSFVKKHRFSLFFYESVTDGLTDRETRLQRCEDASKNDKDNDNDEADNENQKRQ